ncbi:type IV secretion system protein [Pseudomonas sp. hsmgli-8]|uniref:Type IV secretion system protein n=1 Tax=Pseudomonas quercus TaxID=2722792 RepID=A0ABX0YMT4_9PSED|nr:type IV secretion system protein [Pseudomonas quercus]NJP03484.1 type IV secretion system protein [Pseudomonas quercus]
MELHIAQNMYTAVDASLKGTLVVGTAKVMLGLGALFGTFWLLSFTIKSIFWLYQGMTVAFREIVMEIAKVAIIAGLAWNVAWYVQTIVPFVTGLPSWMGGILSGQNGDQVNQIDAFIVTYCINLQKIYDSLSFSITDVKGAYLGLQALLLYLIGGVPFVLMAVGTIMILKVATTVVLALGPLFIAFSLFNQTKQWFWGWVSLVGGFMLTQVLFSIVLALEISFINTVIVKNGVIDTSLIGNVTMVIYFATFTFLAAELPGYAASIMGGSPVSASGIGGIISKGSGLGGAMNAARATRSLGEKIASKIKNRNNIS